MFDPDRLELHRCKFGGIFMVERAGVPLTTQEEVWIQGQVKLPFLPPLLLPLPQPMQ